MANNNINDMHFGTNTQQKVIKIDSASNKLFFYLELQFNNRYLHIELYHIV